MKLCIVCQHTIEQAIEAEFLMRLLLLVPDFVLIASSFVLCDSAWLNECRKEVQRK